MIDEATMKDLFSAFPNSSINSHLEFIADNPANQYFRLDDCYTRFDVEKKVIQYLSRGAYKTEPFYKKAQNDRLHKKLFNGINTFLGTSFSQSDMDLIYTYLGNGCNADLCNNFMKNGYDIDVIVSHQERDRNCRKEQKNENTR